MQIILWLTSISSLLAVSLAQKDSNKDQHSEKIIWTQSNELFERNISVLGKEKGIYLNNKGMF